MVDLACPGHGFLGGIARAPVFLPKKSGHLVLLTEDGVAWIVDGRTGSLEGPWPVGSPPRAGPGANGAAVIVRFANGRVLAWTRGLQPTSGKASGLKLDGSSAAMEVLRRTAQAGQTLDSPWTSLTVKVLPDRYVVKDGAIGKQVFTVGRAGEWQYLAWEAPHTGLPQGRLWVSDGEGLRAFVP